MRCWLPKEDTGVMGASPKGSQRRLLAGTSATVPPGTCPSPTAATTSGCVRSESNHAVPAEKADENVVRLNSGSVPSAAMVARCSAAGVATAPTSLDTAAGYTCTMAWHMVLPCQRLRHAKRVHQRVQHGESAVIARFRQQRKAASGGLVTLTCVLRQYTTSPRSRVDSRLHVF